MAQSDVSYAFNDRGSSTLLDENSVRTLEDEDVLGTEIFVFGHLIATNIYRLSPHKIWSFHEIAP